MNTEPNIRESEHDFALVLTGLTGLPDGVEDALFNAGCDDATIGLRSGRIYMTFSRSASSLKNAILSAIKDVRRAKIGADVLRVDACNLVTQADIARKIGRTRQLVHQYMTGQRGPGGFPAPACDICDGSQLWYWCEVASWLWSSDMIKEDVLREAEDVACINTVFELESQKQQNPQLVEEIRSCVECR